ncbi:MAG TPA: DedA family protein [Vicinamibacterales bacterium]|jgi:membrane protein DedA with SNARE-associated domain|nr:DedA family protein [Vicinamibacterales bacterium]
MAEAILQWIAAYGLGAIFVLLMLGVFGLPVPDETLLTFTGVLIGQGRLGFPSSWAVAASGSMCGITLSYVLGRTGGRAILVHYGSWLHVTHERVTRVERWMEHSGRWALTFGYFVPGVRHLTAIVAGSSELPPSIFALAAYPGAALWSLTFITLGWYVGDRWEEVLAIVHRHLVSASVVLAVGIAAYLLIRGVPKRRDRKD